MSESEAENAPPVITAAASQASGAPSHARLAYGVVVGLLAGLLLAAAGLKADLAVNGGGPGSPPVDTTRTWLGVVAEAAVAAWLLSGLARAWARRAAMALLVVFVAVAGWRLFRGESDCGCFGRLRVHPALTLSVDVVALVAVGLLGQWLTRPAEAGAPRDRGRVLPVRVVLAVLAGIILPGAFVAVGARDPGDGAGDPLLDATLLSPRDWVGKRLPLLDDLAPSDRDLSKGRWVVILVNRGCHSCEDYLAHTDFGAIAWPDGRKASPEEMVLVEAGDHSIPVFRDVRLPFPTVEFRPGPTYLVDGPYEVFVVDGAVKDARRKLGLAAR